MLIDIDLLVTKYGLNISGVIHVGGHIGEEIPIYKKYTSIIHVFEPQEECFSSIDSSVNKYCVALGDKEETLQMFVANNKQSSSLLKPKEHLNQHPDVIFNSQRTVKVYPLDHFKITDCNFINIDVQGYELNVLKGAKKTLKHIDYIYTEINVSEIYENCALVSDLDAFLKDFTRVESTLCGNHGWGDGFYIRNSKL
jgi:FkbM family methyltransferase